MLFELWTDACQPGSNEQALAVLRELAGRAGADTAGYGASDPTQYPEGRRLEAVWKTEFGDTDQVLSLWSLADDATPLADDGAARTVAPTATRERRLLQLEMPFTRDFSGGHLYDLRMYTLQPGTRETFMAHMRQALPVRIRYSRNVGVWTPRSGCPDQIFHIWAYRDLAERDRARTGAWQEPAWQSYLDQILPITRRMQTALLVPAAFSPMQ